MQGRCPISVGRTRVNMDMKRKETETEDKQDMENEETEMLSGEGEREPGRETKKEHSKGSSNQQQQRTESWSVAYLRQTFRISFCEGKLQVSHGNTVLPVGNEVVCNHNSTSMTKDAALRINVRFFRRIDGGMSQITQLKHQLVGGCIVL